MSAKGEWSANSGTYTSSQYFQGKGVGVHRSAKEIRREQELRAGKVDEYDLAVKDYNFAYTEMSDAGMRLLRERERSVDLIRLVEHLVNSIANTPKEYKTDFETIVMQRTEFTNSEQYALEELDTARKTAAGAGAGIAAGTAVVSMAPTAAMWVATTFGTASTGTAISTLSGAAATNAALAWLGGGALAAGGGGMAAGNAFLALAGPVGWTIAGASVLTSIVVMTKKKHKLAAQKNEELAAVKRNAEALREASASIGDILKRTSDLRDALEGRYMESIRLFDEDYRALDANERSVLGSVVNNTVSLSQLLNEKVSMSQEGGGRQ